MRREFLAVVIGLSLAAPAFAQTAGQQPPPIGPTTRTKPHESWSLKGHLSLQVSGGFDLDVFGNILAVSQGKPTPSQSLIVSTTAYPDTYVKTPRRAEAAVGFGIFARDEVFARVSRTQYSATPLNVGVDRAGMAATLSLYKEQSVEVGLRHYFNTGTKRRTYVAISGGQRKINPLSGEFAPLLGDSLGTLRLYDASKVKTISVEFGFTYEMKHLGVYFEGGVRWQDKLTRQDADLTVWGLDTANDTGGRLYMPVQFGFLFRL
jgi:hypothetical protein